MGKIAFVFPGQGSQAVGMAKDAYESVPAATEIFRTADETLGFSLSNLVFEGPETELKQTSNTQPALLTASIALLEAFKEKEFSLIIRLDTVWENTVHWWQRAFYRLLTQ